MLISIFFFFSLLEIEKDRYHPFQFYTLQSSDPINQALSKNRSGSANSLHWL